MLTPLALIIEDERTISDIFEKALRVAEYRTEAIQDGQEALTRLTDTTAVPDIIILDMHLPGASGEELLHYIKQAPHLAQCRIIVTTADARVGELINTQVDLVLIKPVRFSQLRDLAARLNPHR